MSSEGEEEQIEDQEEKKVMRVGIESGLMKKMIGDKRVKDKEGATSSEKTRKKNIPDRVIDEAIQKGKIVRKIKIENKVFNSILDTGSEITIIRKGMEPEGAMNEKSLTKIRLQ